MGWGPGGEGLDSKRVSETAYSVGRGDLYKTLNSLLVAASPGDVDPLLVAVSLSLRDLLEGDQGPWGLGPW